MRLVLAISGLGPGGAERVISLLADALAARQHDVTLVTLAPPGHDFFALDSRVRRLGLGLVGDSAGSWSALRANLRRVRVVRRTLAGLDPDAVLSFGTGTNVLVILACIGLRARLVVSERVDPAAHRAGRSWELLRALMYRRAAAVVVQTNDIAAWFARRLGRSVRLAVIPNPVVRVNERSLQAQIGPAGRFLLAAGRLAPQKGFDLLLRAYAAAAPRLPGVQLLLAGEGPEEQRLRELALQLGVVERVHFAGRVRQLPAMMKAAVAFVLPSRYEGQPNVLLEALAAGVPCVATDCPGGTREILAGGQHGLLVPAEDPVALAAALVRIVVDDRLRAQYSAAAPAALARYDLEHVVTQWERLLSGC